VYAQKFISEASKQDGLYWEARDGSAQSPAGPSLARASLEGYSFGKDGNGPSPYHGYYYRILTRQGPAAPGGAKDYIVDGKLSDGFALVAYPAEYRSSGVMTFLVNQSGVIFQRDLGENTADIAKAMTEYNPDKSWKRIK
jgi:Protein of unknown function (DUF2950)